MKKHGNGKNEDGKITRILIDSWCHQCKMKHQKIVVCDHFWDEDKTTKCNGRYCNNCSKRHYGEDISTLENLENWTCYRCSDRCVCAACRRVRNGELPPNTSHTNGSLIQKGKRKRVKAKVMDEMEEETDESNEVEDEFYPNKFEKNLRSRKNNSNIITSNNTSNGNNKKLSVEKKIVPKVLPTRSSPTKKTKIEKKIKINIPEEDLEKANNSNSMFEILLHVSSLESMNTDSPLSKSTNNLNNINGNLNTNNSNNIGTNSSNPTPNNNNIIPLNKFDPKKEEQLKQFLKYDSITSNPLHPSSFQTVVHLRQEISHLTNELKSMKQEFSKLHQAFEEYVQTHEGSHESSPINFGDNTSPYFNLHPLGFALPTHLALPFTSSVINVSPK